MKKLLALLAVSILTVPVPMALVACGSDEEAETTENFNVEKLLVKAQTEIKLGFSDLLKEAKDLMNEGMYEENKAYIKSQLDSLQPTQSEKKAEIRDTLLISNFLSKIQKDINDTIVKRLLNNAELKPLFRNINPNEILKIKDNTTKLFKLFFNWQDDVREYGVPNYEPKTFDIKWWYRINANLFLDLSYNNRENKQVKKDINHDYIFSYSNTGADIPELIRIATENVAKAFNDFSLQLAVISNDDQNNIIKTKFEQMLKNQISNSKVKIENIEISSIKKLKSSDDSIYKGGNILHEALNKSSPIDMVNHLKTNYLQPIVNEFKKGLNSYIDITKFDNNVKKGQINEYGKVTITDWNIKSLTLRPVDITFVKSRTDQTQDEWATNVSNVIGQMFHPKSVLKKHFDMLTAGNLTVTMNPTDFDWAVSQNHTMWNIRNYFFQKINKKAMDFYTIWLNKKINVSMDGYWSNTPNPRLGDTNFFIKSDNGNTYELPLTDSRRKEQLHGWNYVHINYDNVNFLYGAMKDSSGRNIFFNKTIIKRGTDDFWG